MIPCTCPFNPFEAGSRCRDSTLLSVPLGPDLYSVASNFSDIPHGSFKPLIFQCAQLFAPISPCCDILGSCSYALIKIHDAVLKENMLIHSYIDTGLELMGLDW